MSIEKDLRFAVPQDDASKQKIRIAVQNMVDAFVRMSAENELITEISKEISKEFSIPPAALKKVARWRAKDKFDEDSLKTSSTEDLYVSVFG